MFPPTLPRDSLIEISTAHAYRHCSVLARRAQCISARFEASASRSSEEDGRKQTELKIWKLEANACSDTICALTRSLLDNPGSSTGSGLTALKPDVQEYLVGVYAEALGLQLFRYR